jgi:hypothetical protein
VEELKKTLQALADKYGIDIVREETLKILRRETLRAAAEKMKLYRVEPSAVEVEGRKN